MRKKRKDYDTLIIAKVREMTGEKGFFERILKDIFRRILKASLTFSEYKKAASDLIARTNKEVRVCSADRAAYVAWLVLNETSEGEEISVKDFSEL